MHTSRPDTGGIATIGIRAGPVRLSLGPVLGRCSVLAASGFFMSLCDTVVCQCRAQQPAPSIASTPDCLGQRAEHRHELVDSSERNRPRRDRGGHHPHRGAFAGAPPNIDKRTDPGRRQKGHLGQIDDQDRSLLGQGNLDRGTQPGRACQVDISSDRQNQGPVDASARRGNG